MNIGVYVSSQYGDYYDFSERLVALLKKYTNSPVLLGVFSNMKDTGYELLRKYAEEHRIHLKTYTAEWKRTDDRRFIGKRKQSLGGVIAIYHCVHNSERTIAFDSGGKGTSAFIRMSARLRRPCDIVKVDPFAKRKTPTDGRQKPNQTQSVAKTNPPNRQEPPKIQRNIPSTPTVTQQPTQQQSEPTVAKNTTVQSAPSNQDTAQQRQMPQRTASPSAQTQSPQDTANQRQQIQPSVNPPQQTATAQNITQDKQIQRQIPAATPETKNNVEKEQETVR